MLGLHLGKNPLYTKEYPRSKQKELDEKILASYGIHGKRHLEKKIDKYIKQGSSREEAIGKVAKDAVSCLGFFLCVIKNRRSGASVKFSSI